MSPSTTRRALCAPSPKTIRPKIARPRAPPPRRPSSPRKWLPMAAARSARTGAVNVFVKIGIGARIDSTRPPAELVHDAVAEPFHELRTEFESLLAALEEQAPRPGRQSAYLCGISARTGCFWLES